MKTRVRFLSELLNEDSSKARLVRSAVHQVVVNGVDELSARAIIDDARVSRTTLYQYFGDVVGVLAELWAAEGAMWLEAIAHPSDWSMENSTELDVALVEILSVARRYPEINELVIRDAADFWSRRANENHASQLRTVWTLAGRLGQVLSTPVRGPAPTADAIVSILSSLPDSAGEQVGISTPTPLQSQPHATHHVVPHIDDSVTASLVRASVSVVANAGLAKTSALRVCRVARVTTGSLQSRFSTISEIIEAGFLYATDEIVRRNTENALANEQISPADANAATIPTALSPERTEWRHFKQELHIAARRDKPTARMLRRSYNNANAVLHEQIIRAGLSKEVADAAVEFNEVFSLGLALLHDIGIPILGLDHRVVTRWLFKTFV